MKYTGLLGISVILTGCCTANTKILPKSKSTALVISSSSKEDCAYEKAKEKAVEYCKKKGRSFIVLKDESQYRGMDRTAKGMLEGAGAVMGSHVYLSRDDDYSVRMTFKCVD